MANNPQLRYLEAVLSSNQSAPHASSRGFTLIEMLAVVVITGVLSLLAVAGFRRHMQSAHGTEAMAVIQAVRSAQEAYMAENHVYLDVSSSSGGVSWYPRLIPVATRVGFSAPSHPDYTRWQKLAPSVNQSVMFSYLVNAGVPGTIIPPLQVAKAPPFTTAQTLDWYVIQASGDIDGNGVFSRYASTSMTGEIYIENEGE